MEMIATLELENVTHGFEGINDYKSLVLKIYGSKDEIGTENYDRWDLGDITINKDVLEFLGYGGD